MHYCCCQHKCQQTGVSMAASCPGYRLTRPDVERQTGALFPVCGIVTSLCWQDESDAKPDGRGDSAVSKGTTDSGVVMEAVQVSSLPGQVPRQLPVDESESDPSTDWMRQTIAGNVIKVPSVCVFARCCASKVQRDSGRAAEPGNYPCGTEEQHFRRGLQHRGTSLSQFST